MSLFLSKTYLMSSFGPRPERRWKICLECPHLKYDETNPDTNKVDGRCTHCGCFMNVKVHYAVAECPIGKWPKECKCNQSKDCDE